MAHYLAFSLLLFLVDNTKNRNLQLLGWLLPQRISDRILQLHWSSFYFERDRQKNCTVKVEKHTSNTGLGSNSCATCEEKIFQSFHHNQEIWVFSSLWSAKGNHWWHPGWSILIHLEDTLFRVYKCIYLVEDRKLNHQD